MAVSKKLKQFLDEQSVDYEEMQHATAYTAQEIAGAQHVPGQEAIKSVIVKSNGSFIMSVLPAVRLVDLEKFKAAANAGDAELAAEEDLAQLFPDYELGAEPPFGNLYGLKVYADSSLEDNDTVVFNAGTHTDTIRLTYEDFKRLSDAEVADIGKHI